MEITSNKFLASQRAHHNFTLEVPVTNTPSIEGVLLPSETADPYEQAMQFVREIGHPTVGSHFHGGTVSGDLNRVKAQMQAAKREFNQTEDFVNGLSAKRDQYSVVADGRTHIAPLDGLIRNIHTGYQKTYGDIIKKATEYMQEMNTAIATMSDCILEDGGSLKLLIHDYAKKIDKSASKYFGLKYSGSDPKKYFPSWNPSHNDINPLMTFKGNQEQYHFWDKKLSSQGLIVKYENGNIKILPDPKPIKEIYRIMDDSPAPWNQNDKVLAQSVQSFQIAIDSQKSAINSGVSRLLETFRQDNSHFDTLVQLLIQLMKDLNQYNNGLINM